MLMPSIFGDDLFDDFMRFPGDHEFHGRPAPELMKTDIRDTGDSYELDIDLPGYKKEDVKLQLKEGYLTIQATRNENNDEKDSSGKYIRRERFMGQCSRSFFIGKNIEQREVHAKFQDGILKVTFPKQETKKEIDDRKFISIED
ncbi:MAG: Hsp20/alpha crystallin family protein [Clostridiales bacterium]|nr:Hsp20/alpha crystallin family protein [Clostridiales bacterium]